MLLDVSQIARLMAAERRMLAVLENNVESIWNDAIPCDSLSDLVQLIPVKQSLLMVCGVLQSVGKTWSTVALWIPTKGSDWVRDGDWLFYKKGDATLLGIQTPKQESEFTPENQFLFNTSLDIEEAGEIITTLYLDIYSSLMTDLLAA